jgi:hypothetical protein
MECAMNRILASLLAMVAGGSATEQTHAELVAVERFRNRQKRQPRSVGSMRRSSAYLDLATGRIQRGTRDPRRGPYPQHMIDQSQAFHARQAARMTVP